MRRILAGGILSIAVAMSQVRDPKPGFNLFSKQDDIQLGKESAAQIEKEYEVINDSMLQSYISEVGRRLTASKRASDFPYFFKIVHDDSINAFALPGGPMYIHTGLPKAADNEGQLAGVMAHEISHVALRHGTNQASKANLIQIPTVLAGKAGGGLLGGLASMGIGLGANSVLMKFSRGAESQADYNGTLILSDAGYNPIEMARFFEKLAGEGGRQSGIAAFFSSHPDPGNRMQAVQALVAQLPQRQYTDGDAAALQRVKAAVAKLPPAKQKKPAQETR